MAEVTNRVSTPLPGELEHLWGCEPALGDVRAHSWGLCSPKCSRLGWVKRETEAQWSGMVCSAHPPLQGPLRGLCSG